MRFTDKEPVYVFTLEYEEVGCKFWESPPNFLCPRVNMFIFLICKICSRGELLAMCQIKSRSLSVGYSLCKAPQ